NMIYSIDRYLINFTLQLRLTNISYDLSQNPYNVKVIHF
ncbi:hypothetical protein ICS_04683, partial [Bacillus cereus BAG2O-3]